MKPYSPPKGSKVVVAMSGGVDSSVVAAMLVEQGYEVVGMMLRLWNDDECDTENRCCTPESVAEARRIAGKFGFPFYAIDAKKSFYNTVVQHFLNGYKAGITPNPCLVCNAAVRWKILLEEATAIGAQFISTGHYAQLKQDDEGKVHLQKGLDSSKDQSYVLSFLSQQYLSQTFLPLGTLTKPEVRELARRFGLEVAEKPDSQDLCFLGSGTLLDFLQRHATESLEPGEIKMPDGSVVGKHQGLASYTIGQRKGIRIASPRPLYVVEKDLETNTLIVGYEEHLGRNTFEVHSPRWISHQPTSFPFSCEVKTRYKSQPITSVVELLPSGNLGVTTSHPLRDITPGQGAVFYIENEVIGSGIIEQF